MKTSYERPIVEVLEFDERDVVTTSDQDNTNQTQPENKEEKITIASIKK